MSVSASGNNTVPPVDLHSHGQYQQQVVLTPEQLEYDILVHSSKHSEVSETPKYRHDLYK